MTSDRTIKAAAIQWDVGRGEVESNLAFVVESLERAAEDKVGLVVLPEMWASSFMGDDADEAREPVAAAEQKLLEMTGDLRLLVVGSNYEFSPDGRVFNRARVFENGQELGEYRKIHLFSPQGEDRFFAHGSTPLVVDTSVGRVGVALCYDLRFPELIRHLFLAGAELLLLPSQWPEPREGHWRILARARALEDQWFVVAANRCGVEPSLITGRDVVFPGNSMIIDPTGTVLGVGDGTPGVVTAELDLKETAIMRRAIPVGKDRQPEIYDGFETDLVVGIRREE